MTAVHITLQHSTLVYLPPLDIWKYTPALHSSTATSSTILYNLPSTISTTCYKALFSFSISFSLSHLIHAHHSPSTTTSTSYQL